MAALSLLVLTQCKLDDPTEIVSINLEVGDIRKLRVDSVQVVEDEDGNGLLNDGESVYLRVFIKNDGTEPLEDVSARFRVLTDQMSNLPDDSVRFGDIQSGQQVFGGEGISPTTRQRFTINPTLSVTASSSGDIRLLIDIQDRYEGYWLKEMMLPVHPTFIKPLAYYPFDDQRSQSLYGGPPAVIVGGEYVNLDYFALLDTGKQVSVSLTVDNSYIRISDPSILNSAQERTISFWFNKQGNLYSGKRIAFFSDGFYYLLLSSDQNALLSFEIANLADTKIVHRFQHIPQIGPEYHMLTLVQSNQQSSTIGGDLADFYSTELYLDGLLVDQTTKPIPVSINPQELSFFRKDTRLYFVLEDYDGYADNIRIYDQALPSETIQSIYEQEKPR